MSVAAIEDLEIPRVQGRHRNKALAQARVTKAIQLVVNGYNYQQVADLMGYAHRGTVHRLVNQALAAHTKQSAEDARAEAFMKLEALLGALWGAAMSGNIPAVRACHRLVMFQCRVMGLLDRETNPTKPPARNCGGYPETVVTRDDDCRHEGCAIHGKFVSPGDLSVGESTGASVAAAPGALADPS